MKTNDMTTKIDHEDVQDRAVNAEGREDIADEREDSAEGREETAARDAVSEALDTDVATVEKIIGISYLDNVVSSCVV